MFSRRHIKLALKSLSLLLIVVAVVSFVAMNAGKNRLLSVQSGSMAPAISQGDLVSVKSVPYEQLVVGDVITFISPDKETTITHRIVSLLPEDPAGNNIITKGDANVEVDEPIEASSVVGKVDRNVPYLGHGIDFLKSWPGLVLMVYIPALIIVIIETRRLSAYYRSLHYVLPEWLVRRTVRPSFMGRNLAIAGMIGLTSLAIALPVHAALQSSAELTGNTITVADLPEPPPEPEPEPEPEPVPDKATDLSIRRVFIACEEGETTATHVQIVLYNASRQAADISGWTIKSGNQTLLTIPGNTQISGPGLYETEAPIIEGISYSHWHLTLRNQDNEQIHEHTWDINTTRTCRLRQ